MAPLIRQGGPAAREHARRCRRDTGPAVCPGTDPSGAGNEAAVMTTAVPPLSGGTGEHGSEATHAFTIADSVGGVGGWSASRTGRVLALGQMFWTACRQAAWMDKAELSWLMGTPAECSAGGVRSVARLPDFPEVRIRAERLDIREFGPADASLVSEVLEGGEWLPLSTALVGASDSEYPADVDWWLADAVHEPRRDRTGLNLMMLAREDDRIAGWIYLTDVDTYACSAQIGYGVRPHARGRGF